MNKDTSNDNTRLEEMLGTFNGETEDLWEQFMEGDNPDPEKYDQLLDNAYNKATQAISDLIAEQCLLARIDELEMLAALDDPENPDDYVVYAKMSNTMNERLKQLQAQRGEKSMSHNNKTPDGTSRTLV